MRRLAVFLIVMLSFPLFCLAEEDAFYESQVVQIVEGDIIELINGATVRLIGIDAPEIDTAEGQRARQYLKEMGIMYSSVLLKFGEEKYDRYGRLLAYVYFDLNQLKDHGIKPESEKYFYYDENKNVFLNATLIKAGYAKPMNIPPNDRYADFFRNLYKEAKEEKRGLFKEEEQLSIK